MSFGREIVFLSDAERAGGAERYLDLLLRGFGREATGLLHLAQASGTAQWCAALRDEGFHVESVEGRGLFEKLSALWRWARRVRPYAVHVNLPGPYDGIFGLAPRLLRIAGVRHVVVTEHLPSVGRVGKRYWSKRLGIGSVSAAIALSRPHRQLIHELFGYPLARCHVVPNGVSAPGPDELRLDFPPDLAARERDARLPRVVQIGSLEERKGVRVALAAAATLFRAGRGFNLWFVGEGPLRGELERMVTDQGLESCVRLAGHREDVPAVWNGASVGLLASYREGMPLSLIEAMAHGVPCVSTTVDGIPDLIEDGAQGLLVRPGDPASLAEALSRLIVDADLRSQMGEASRLHFERYHTAERMVENTRTVYRQLGIDL